MTVENIEEKFNTYSYLTHYFQNQGYKGVYLKGLWLSARGGLWQDTISFLRDYFSFWINFLATTLEV